MMVTPQVCVKRLYDMMSNFRCCESESVFLSGGTETEEEEEKIDVDFQYLSTIFIYWRRQ